VFRRDFKTSGCWRTAREGGAEERGEEEREEEEGGLEEGRG
jgi:hypothetical protein